jgi:hypothetical protein
MTIYKEVIHNVVTGEITERPYTAEEIAEVEAAQVESAKLVAQMNKADADKTAAVAKLAALGLTADDLKALGLGNN